MPSPALPRVAVLLATFNGLRWLPEQLDSILDQEGVDVRVIALDDESTDGTREWLLERAATEPRLAVLDPMGASGSAAANFLRLIRTAPLDPDELIAFADQDDVWSLGKLARHVRLLRERDADGVSSNVTAFHADGRRTLVRKDYPQREFDYLLESPGPGSTFLMTPRLIALVRDVLSTQPDASRVDYHDWLVYAIARAAGMTWHIDSESTVDYRQHGDNAMGANLGASQASSRLALIRSRWHRTQAATLARIGLAVAAPDRQSGLVRMRNLFERTGPRSRLALLLHAGQVRRRPRDRWIIRVLIALGVW